MQHDILNYRNCSKVRPPVFMHAQQHRTIASRTCSKFAGSSAILPAASTIPAMRSCSDSMAVSYTRLVMCPQTKKIKGCHIRQQDHVVQSIGLETLYLNVPAPSWQNVLELHCVGTTLFCGWPKEHLPAVGAAFPEGKSSKCSH